jgi:hypothetical protein
VSNSATFSIQLDKVARERSTIRYQRKKPGRKPLSKHIPRDVIRYELPEAERFYETCPVKPAESDSCRDKKTTQNCNSLQAPHEAG